jgi:chemoreceptor zinc-binding protein
MNISGGLFSAYSESISFDIGRRKMSSGFAAKVMSMLGFTEAAREEVRREINFYEAVEAHLAWKRRLDEYLSGRSDEDLRPEVICQDNRCVLGKWIHGAGKARLGGYPLFHQLIDEHSKFHYHASKVVEAHQAGNQPLAAKLLQEDFLKQSKRTVACLAKLHAEVQGDEAAHA